MQREIGRERQRERDTEKEPVYLIETIFRGFSSLGYSMKSVLQHK